MGGAAGWPAMLLEIMKARWQVLLDLGGVKFPGRKADEKDLRVTVNRLNEFRAKALEKVPPGDPAHLDARFAEIPAYVVQGYGEGDAAPVPPSLGDLKKRKELNLLSDGFRDFFHAVLEPEEQALQRKVRERKQSQTEAMQAELQQNKRQRVEPEDAGEAKSLAKLQIGAILEDYHRRTGNSKSDLLKELEYEEGVSAGDPGEPMVDLRLRPLLLQGTRSRRGSP